MKDLDIENAFLFGQQNTIPAGDCNISGRRPPDQGKRWAGESPWFLVPKLRLGNALVAKLCLPLRDFTSCG
jgi:hypothetical protein